MSGEVVKRVCDRLDIRCMSSTAYNKNAIAVVFWLGFWFWLGYLGRGSTEPFFRVPGRGGHMGGPATKWGGRGRPAAGHAAVPPAVPR
jgi:hypothetical protein